ncbi:glycosyltransferase family 4 protein [Solirubrobacter soli]|uniref:glycosyltransferase family 4 protein n=1 Tax=Solirubrobacter soli TaxID=363832 RepID=UPI000413BF77|nr:glycosyltransferase family 4 protein [Solirubrobacter soli]
MGLQFFPRGGSAQVARNLAHSLPGTGWETTILSGSITHDDTFGDAAHFYRGLDVRPVDMTRALHARDPMAADPPLHPSYEDRLDAPDRCFAMLDDDETEHQVVAWAKALQSAGAAHADVLHLHHLTPLYEAARRVAPDVPVVGHLHGTELLMLEAIDHDPYRWAHGEAWAERMRGWAEQAHRLIVLTETACDRAATVLGIDPRRCATVPNGFDPERFGPRAVDRVAVHRKLGVEIEDDTPVLLYVGRFTEVKRIPLLIEAYERARPGFSRRAPLVIVGGFPNEFEGEHPDDAIARTGARDVHLTGWHDHSELPDILNASDALVLSSVREQFGQVIVEAMACGLPAIAVDAYGPAEIVDHGETGWLVEPDDISSLANALVEAVNRPGERRRRGANAARRAHDHYAWPSLARRVAEIYDDAVDATSLRENAALSG